MKKIFIAGLLPVIAAVSFALIAQAAESISSKADTSLKAEQEASVSGLPVQTYETLVNEVLENNPELKFYEAEIDAAKGLRKTAGLWSNPELSSSIGQKRVRSSSEGESTTAKGTASEIVVTQSLEWPGRIRLRKAIAERDIKLAELGLEQFRAALTARVKTAIFQVSASKEKALATSEVAEHFRALREVLIQRDQAGLTPMLETRIIEAMELNIQRKASEATLASQAAIFDLNQLRGAAPGASINLPKVNLKFRSIEKDINELVELARSNDFQVRVRAMELEKQAYKVKLAKNERFPAITAGPAISQERAGDSERIIGAAISLPIPLWDRNQGNIAVAKAEQTQAETSLSIAQREAERQVVEAANIYETKLREMAHWRPDSIQHFKEAAELADRHYRLGAVPVSTYVELQSQYLDTIEGLLDTKKEALESAARLELLAGADLSLTDAIKGETR